MRPARLRLAVLAAVVLALPAAAAAQSDYELRYGAPVDVALSDLANSPEQYQERAVRTKGRLELSAAARRTFQIRDGFGNAAIIVPVYEAEAEFERIGLSIMGQEIEVTGVVMVVDSNSAFDRSPGMARVAIRFWAFTGPPEKEKPGDVSAAPRVTLESLVTSPGRRDGQLVRVVGKFRGKNLYGDLPSRSQRLGGDWVIKDEAFAVWVTGKKPKGKGFELDTSLRRDTGKWLEVVGRVVSRGGVTYIDAREVLLSAPPTPTAEVQPPPPPPERPKVAPVVVFAMPLDGEAEVPPDSRFIVQFNKDMDEASFNGRVLLRYAGPVMPGDAPFTQVKVSYDRGRKALTVDPGTMLLPGRAVELVLLPGITDLEGLTLAPRATAGDGVADVLRFQVGT